MTKQYRVSEFAKLAGVTVRTLQYYDRAGLLQPSATTAGGHRLYVAADLLRLQQIVTLKWMGFKLEQIKTILASETYDFKAALIQQKAAVDAQIAQLETTSAALATAIEAVDAQAAEQLDPETLRAIIHGITWRGPFMDEYFSQTAQAGIALRWMTSGQADMEAAQVRWQALYSGFEALLNYPFDHPEVVALAAEMDRLIIAFTAQDQETEAGLRRLIIDAEQGRLPDAPDIQAHFSAQDNDLRQFMQQALTHYRQTQQSK